MANYNSFGSGPEKVLVMHNWLCDTSSYRPMLPYLDPQQFTFLFMDLRGYGGAKDVIGTYSLQEASDDALHLADSLGWKNFHIIGHSMSGMIAQKIALDHSARVKSLIGIAPVHAAGSPRTPELMTFLEGAALFNEASALECIHVLTNRRYSHYIAKKMADQWRLCSTPEARMAYLHMFCNTDFSKESKGLQTPMLIIFGEHDLEDEEALSDKTFLKWYPNAFIECCKNAGHFPMQETPIYLASLIEKFLCNNSAEIVPKANKKILPRIS